MGGKGCPRDQHLPLQPPTGLICRNFQGLTPTRGAAAWTERNCCPWGTGKPLWPCPQLTPSKKVFPVKQTRRGKGQAWSRKGTENKCPLVLFSQLMGSLGPHSGQPTFSLFSWEGGNHLIKPCESGRGLFQQYLGITLQGSNSGPPHAKHHIRPLSHRLQDPKGSSSFTIAL